MAIHSYSKCSFRAKYDNNPTSFLGRIWRWHTEYLIKYFYLFSDDMVDIWTTANVG